MVDLTLFPYNIEYICSAAYFVDHVRPWLLENIGVNGDAWNITGIERTDAGTNYARKFGFKTKDHAVLFSLRWL